MLGQADIEITSHRELDCGLAKPERKEKVLSYIEVKQFIEFKPDKKIVHIQLAKQWKL